MTFDIETFSKFAERAYRNTSGQGYSIYGFNESLEVFRLYFAWYEHIRRRVHPNIRLIQIENILTVMPYLDDTYRGNQITTIDIEPECYEEIIPQHFKTRYNHCDYNINHFFSGDIRTLRFFETCY